MVRRRDLPLAVVLFAIVVVYANSFGNGFHFDDFHAVRDNPAVRSLSGIPRIFRDATAFSVLPANQTYRPVVTASLALDYALGHGYNVFWFHLSTLVWFLSLVVVLERLAEQVYGCAAPGVDVFPWALGVAAWFGLHPAMAETVNYIIQRGDLYCTLGCVAALWLYANRPGWRRFGGYLLPFAMAMLAKLPAAVFPVLLLLYAGMFEHAATRGLRRWVRALVSALPALVVDGLLLSFEHAMTPKSYAPSILSAGAYRLMQPYVWLRYCGALFLPIHLNVDTDLAPAAHVDVSVLCGFAFVLLVGAAVVWALRQRRRFPIALGLLWFVVTQLPTSLYTLSEVENDHRMFFSFPGLMLAVVWAGHLLVERMAVRRIVPRWVPAGVCVALLCPYAYGTTRRNLVWRDEATLWVDDVRKSPHNGRGLMNYGLVKMNAGDLDGAKALFTEAQRYTPNYATLEVNLAVVNGLLADAGKGADAAAEAERHFQRATALQPGDDTTHAFYGRWLLTHGRLEEATAQLTTAVALNEQRAMQRDLLMEALARNGRIAEAKQLATTTLGMYPEDGTAATVLHGGVPGGSQAPFAAAGLINASLAAYRAGQFAASVRYAQQALAMEPRSAEAWNNVGAGYGAMGLWAEGIHAEQQALALNPGLAIAGNNLRWFQSEAARASGPKTAAAYVNDSLALNKLGQFEASLRAARQATELDPQSAEAWNNIAANEEAMGHWDAAIAAAQRALALRPAFTLARNNLRWSEEQKSHATQP